MIGIFENGQKLDPEPVSERHRITRGVRFRGLRGTWTHRDWGLAISRRYERPGASWHDVNSDTGYFVRDAEALNASNVHPDERTPEQRRLAHRARRR